MDFEFTFLANDYGEAVGGVPIVIHD
jgi:hypothetical protein